MNQTASGTFRSTIGVNVRAVAYEEAIGATSPSCAGRHFAIDKRYKLLVSAVQSQLKSFENAVKKHGANLIKEREQVMNESLLNLH
jgi:hypothetical protein